MRTTLPAATVHCETIGQYDDDAWVAWQVLSLAREDRHSGQSLVYVCFDVWRTKIIGKHTQNICHNAIRQSNSRRQQKWRIKHVYA